MIKLILKNKKNKKNKKNVFSYFVLIFFLIKGVKM